MKRHGASSEQKKMLARAGNVGASVATVLGNAPKAIELLQSIRHLPYRRAAVSAAARVLKKKKSPGTVSLGSISKTVMDDLKLAIAYVNEPDSPFKA